MRTLICIVIVGVVLVAGSTAWAGVILTPPVHRGNGDLLCLIMNAGIHDDSEVTMEIRNGDNVVVGNGTNNIPAGGIETIGTSTPNPSGSSFYCRVSGINRARVTLCVLDSTSGTPLVCVSGP